MPEGARVGTVDVEKSALPLRARGRPSSAADRRAWCVARPSTPHGGGVGDHEAFILWDVIIESQDLSRTIATTSAQVRQVIGEFDELRIVSRLQYLDHDRLVGAPRAALVLAQGL